MSEKQTSWPGAANCAAQCRRAIRTTIQTEIKMKRLFSATAAVVATQARFALATLLMLGVFGVPALARSPGTTERFSLKLSIPSGYCALDQSHPVDASVLAIWQKTFAPGIERLLGGAVECSQLDAWRKPPLVLVDFSQFL